MRAGHGQHHAEDNDYDIRAGSHILERGEEI